MEDRIPHFSPYDEISDDCSLLLTLGAQMIYIQNVSQSGGCPVDHVCILME